MLGTCSLHASASCSAGWGAPSAATTQIFLRELRGKWKLEAAISKIAQTVAENLNIDLDQFEGEWLARIETALVKLGLRWGLSDAWFVASQATTT